MKKSNCILCICVTGSIAGSIVVLLAIYNYSLCTLIEEFFCAVFTGCLFAVPSGLLIVIEDIKQIRNEKMVLLSDLNTYLEGIAFKGYSEYDPEEVENIRFHLVEIYKLLGRELDENYLRKKEKQKIEELLNIVFDISCIIVELNEKYEKISQQNFNDDIKHVYELKESCCKVIQEIEENDY